VLPKGKDLTLSLHFYFGRAWEHSELWSRVNFDLVLKQLGWNILKNLLDGAEPQG